MADVDKKNEFMQAYEHYADAIYRHCFFRVFSKERAEELMQETFMKTWQYLSNEEKEIKNIRPFLYRVATNLIIDESRKKKDISLDALIEESDAREPAYEGHKDAEKRALLKELYGNLEKLNADEKNLIVMRFVDDLDIAEIADILEITSNNVSVKLTRAVEKLKTL